MTINDAMLNQHLPNPTLFPLVSSQVVFQAFILQFFSALNDMDASGAIGSFLC